ncbi:hypothetical protein HRbin36_01461 [bacterium HR36]|nr:hypothetical protein HRbin36_01461 [bacterium HR36]
MRIDLNADVAEGVGNEAELLPLVTSANVACAAHAGSPADIWFTLQLAKRLGVVVGAHPGYFDREHFGRRELSWQPESLHAELVYQLSALQGLAQAAGVQLHYLKPHGALYNQACREEPLADLLARLAKQWNLALVGLPNSWLERCAARQGVRFCREGFADRRYQPDGSLVPRHRADAFVDDPQQAAQQVLRLVEEYRVQTVCVHGDRPGVVAFTRHLREELERRGVTVRPWCVS